MKEIDCKDVSVVVCTKNAKATIEQVILSIKRNNPKEIIVVDANSQDGTREILEGMGVRVLTDPGKGLALARQIGIENASGEFVFFAGDDNIFAKNSIGRVKRYIMEHGWIGGSMLTRVKTYSKNYWSFCSNERWKARFYEGKRSVIGTPYMFYANVLKEEKYDPKMKFSDDADIEKRILEKTKGTIGYTNVMCYEIGKDDFKETCIRFSMYGKSDYEFWKKYSNSWNISRKINSVLHVWRDELVNPMKRIVPRSLKIYVMPYFFIITFIRYKSWVKEAIKDKIA